jgi:hypothetical protein
MGMIDLLRPQPTSVAFAIEGDRVYLRQGAAGSEQVIVLHVEQLRRLQRAVATAARPIAPLNIPARLHQDQKTAERAR